jgi:CRISPR-associated endoribonuclease Cas6
MPRFILCLSSDTEPVGFDYLNKLRGALHKWLGRNDRHDGLSLYSFGLLRGGRREGRHLTFPKGATWPVSFYEPDMARRLLRGILQQPEVAYGMRVLEVREQAAPDFDAERRFLVDGPVVIRRTRNNGGRDYLLWDNPHADAILTRVMRHKLEAAGYAGAHLQTTVRFDRTYPRGRTRLFEIKGIRHRGSECPVIVTGTPEAVRFAWLVGAGELTGCGFGALR